MLEHQIAVALSEEVILEPTLPADFFQEICQSVRRGELPEQGILDDGGGAVGDDVVHCPACLLQIGPGLPVLRLAGQLLLPPGSVVYPKRRPLGVQCLEPLQEEQRVIGFQDAVPDIVAAGAAHGEDAFPAQLKYLAPFQQEHRWADAPHLPTMPFLRRIGAQSIVVLMVTGHEGRSKRPLFQEIQSIAVPVVSIPHAAKVACNQEDILLVQPLLLVEKFR